VGSPGFGPPAAREAAARFRDHPSIIRETQEEIRSGL